MIKNGKVQFTAPVGVSDEGTIIFDCGIEYLTNIILYLILVEYISCRGSSYEERNGGRTCSFTGAESSRDDEHGDVMATATTRIRKEDRYSKMTHWGVTMTHWGFTLSYCYYATCVEGARREEKKRSS